jgi:DNA-binding NarL/FixJ family response regulator
MIKAATPLSVSSPTEASGGPYLPASSEPGQMMDKRPDMRGPFGPPQSSASAVAQAAEAVRPPVIIYIDKQQLGRECVSEQLASHLSEWTIEPVAAACELQKKEGERLSASLIILHAHGASLSTTDLVDEMATIAAVAPGLPLFIISDLDEADEALLALQLGARGYLPANLPLPQAVGAIRLVAGGGTYIPTCVLSASSGIRRTPPARMMGEDGKPISFSPRQQQVLELLKQGKQNKIIAYELNMCESTVKVHIRHIMRKLNARNRTQVVLLTSNMGDRSAVHLAA